MRRQTSLQSYVVLRVINVKGDEVVLRPVLDRYRIPLDPHGVLPHTFPLETLV